MQSHVLLRVNGPYLLYLEAYFQDFLQQFFLIFDTFCFKIEELVDCSANVEGLLVQGRELV